jgi:sterol-4alpha-carboxylate 3-dehydrogenase (decarboxylating)
MAPTKAATLGHVALIGGSGFLGMNIVKLILELYPHSKISALDVNIKNNRVENSKVSYHLCDITDLLAVEELFLKLKPDVVIHTAAIVPTQGTPDSVTYRVNVEGTQNLITASRNTDVKAFVYTSSSSVIVGNVSDVINGDESWPVCFGKDQPEYYSETKVRLDHLLL